MRKSYPGLDHHSYRRFAAVAASAQSFRVQCPTCTITHPLTGTNCSTNPTPRGATTRNLRTTDRHNSLPR